METGESAREAASRELAEETGVSAHLDDALSNTSKVVGLVAVDRQELSAGFDVRGRHRDSVIRGRRSYSSARWPPAGSRAECAGRRWERRW
ncbi:NUDIX hydrolase [Streptomyces sp. A73]|nr:NUDIX hydrolase [Streptomyces sp. A73]